MNAPDQMHSDAISATQRKCRGCPALFTPKRGWQLFCADSCRTDFHRKKNLGPEGRIQELERRVAELERRVGALDQPVR